MPNLRLRPTLPHLHPSRPKQRTRNSPCQEGKVWKRDPTKWDKPTNTRHLFQYQQRPKRKLHSKLRLMSLKERKLPSLQRRPSNSFQALLRQQRVNTRKKGEHLLFPPKEEVNLQRTTKQIQHRQPTPPRRRQAYPHALRREQRPSRNGQRATYRQQQLLRDLPPKSERYELCPNLPFTQLPTYATQAIPISQPNRRKKRERPFSRRHHQARLPPPSNRKRERKNKPTAASP